MEDIPYEIYPCAKNTQEHKIETEEMRKETRQKQRRAKPSVKGNANGCEEKPEILMKTVVIYIDTFREPFICGED